jgi:TolB-like protein/thioredoxin-like negative regulator of GroEL
MSLFAELKRRNVLRVGAAYVALSWLIIQVIEALFPMFGLSDAAARVIVILLAIGLVPALICAWVFELTPDGFKRDSEIDHASRDSRKLARRLDRLIIVVLVIALGYFAVDKFVIDPARDQAREEEVAREARTDALVESYGDYSIAVLPFEDMSPEGDQEYFSNGISEELLNLLARIPELRVISRSSAFSFKGQDIHIPTVAEKLNVAHVLEGSVRKSGDRIRITAQLIDARTDTHLWSETYERTLDDVFAIQDEVAARVVEQLHVTLLGKMPRTTPVDTRAYGLYLKAGHIFSLQMADQFDDAIRLLQQATEIEPEFVDAWVLLHYVYAMYRYGAYPERREEMAALATETYDRVLAIDPENSTALAWMAEKAMADDPVRAARLLEKAASIDPTDVFVNWQAIELALELGRLDLAIEISEYLVVRDPLLFWGQLNLADYYFEAGRVDDAMHRYEIALSLNENAGAVRWKYGLARLMNGDPEGALGQFEMEPGKVYKLMGLAAAYHDLGRYEDSARTFAELIELEADKWPWGIARAYGWIGDADQAFFWLERTRETDPGYLGGVERIPLLQKLHSDPRWLPLLRSVGRAPEQIPAVEFNFKVPG